MQSGVCLQTSDAVVSAGSALAVVRRWWVCPLSTASDVSFPRAVALALVLALVRHWCCHSRHWKRTHRQQSS